MRIMTHEGLLASSLIMMEKPRLPPNGSPSAFNGFCGFHIILDDVMCFRLGQGRVWARKCRKSS